MKKKTEDEQVAWQIDQIMKMRPDVTREQAEDAVKVLRQFADHLVDRQIQKKEGRNLD
jgi:hypothetical protein